MRTTLHESLLTRSLVIAGALAAPFLSAAQDVAPDWQMLDAGRFRVLSQLEEGETRAWARQFDQFLSALATVLPADEDALAPLSVVLFAEDAGFAEYKPADRHGKRSNHIGGFFAAREAWSTIGLAGRRTEAETRETVFHEGVHWYTSAQPHPPPVWVEEGLADVFSTFRVNGNQAVWGDAPAGYRTFVRAQSPLPPAELQGVKRGDAILDDEHGASRFYVGSWALVHHHLFAGPDEEGPGFEARARILQSAGWGASDSAGDACRSGASVPDSLVDYLSHQLPAPVTRPLPATGENAWVVTTAGIRERETALARLALGAGRVPLALAHAQRLLEAAPEHGASFALAAEVAAEAGDRERTLAWCVRALELGSDDAAVHHLLAETNFQILAEDGEVNAADARGVANLYLRALELRPFFRRAYRNLARLLCSVEGLEARDLAVLEQGRRLYPGDGEIALGLAVLALNRGDQPAAARWVGEALQPAAELSEEAREAARALAAVIAS